MAHGSVAVPYCWDQCFVPHGTGAGLTEEGVCCWLTRLERHLEDSLPPPPGVLLRHPRRAEHHRPRMAYTYRRELRTTPCGVSSRYRATTNRLRRFVWDV